MKLEFDLHPDAEQSLTDFRLSILDGKTPKFATNEELVNEHIWEGLIKVAIARFPDPAFDAAAKQKKTEYDDFVEAEFAKKRLPSVAVPEKEK